MFASDTDISDFVQMICRKCGRRSNELIIGAHDNAEAYLERLGVDPAYHRWIIRARSKQDADIAINYLYENAEYEVDRSSQVESKEPWVFVFPASEITGRERAARDAVVSSVVE